MSGLYLYRLAARSPDVSWNRRANPRPWEVYDSKNYKFLSTRDEYKSQAPKID
jgi:NADH dehydrogenase (ubiquinone) 1 alpha subcomplex subunit 4